MKVATQLHRGSIASNDNWYKRPFTFGHHSGLAHPRQDAVQFANFHSCDDSLDRWDELVLLANCDCSFTPLKLNGLCDRDGKFSHEFYKELASEGWLGVCIPEAYGGSGLGITEAAIMMEAISASGAGFSGASAVHMNIFSVNQGVVYGSEEERSQILA